MKNLFKTKFDAAVIVLIPACIGINYLGKLFASVLKLPLWLDSIGTCIGGCLGGPIIGAICGAANNLIYGFSAGDNITLIYALTSLGIGAAAGIMALPWIYEIIPEGNSYSLCSRSCCGCDLHPVKRIILGRHYWKCMGRRCVRGNSGSFHAGISGISVR